MLEEDDVIVWVEERLDSISSVDGIFWNVLCGIRKKLWASVFCTSIRKKLWTSVFCTSKSIVISEDSTNGI